MPVNRSSAIILSAVLAVGSICPCSAAEHHARLTFACKSDNDLFRIWTAGDLSVRSADSPADAIRIAPEGSGVLLLADGYPELRTPIDANLLRAARQKRLRLYVEYPAFVPETESGPPRRTRWERTVVASDVFGTTLPPMRILAIHDCHFLPMRAERAYLVLARVAGYDRALFGLPDETFPILLEPRANELLVATTKLSQLVTARYAPKEAWQKVWQWIFHWLDPAHPGPAICWTPSVRPSYEPGEPLAPGAAIDAVRRGASWYPRSQLLTGTIELQLRALRAKPENNEEGIEPAPPADSPPGDGRLGILEGHNSQIRLDGSQPVRWFLRADCNCESAMALALCAMLDRNDRSRLIAANLLDFVYFHSNLQQGPRADPTSPSYGLLGWCAGSQYCGLYYGDDNARSILATMAVAAALGSDRWDEPMLRAILANFRTTGQSGFRGSNLGESVLHERGWRHFFHANPVNPAPHYESWLWACYLWLYDKTRYEPLRQRARTAVRLTMDRYPSGWRWTNGQKQIERARMLLPLAWLVRVEDTPQHRRWLQQIAEDLLSFQDSSGAIQEEIASSLRSNAEYGTCETSLLAQNGDPVADMLYTCNFALISLNEAAAATGNPGIAGAADRLAEFLIRIQIRSHTHPDLDGAWFRGFDFRRWEPWGSNGDSGWGAWCTETGWTQGCIVAGLALRQARQSLWQLTAQSRAAAHFEKLRRQMLPDEHDKDR